MSIRDVVERNYRAVQQRIAEAAERAGRDPAGVQLVAVTKYAEVDSVRTLIDLGHQVLGENRPQQLLERAELLAAGPAEIRWHLIGHLQRNKVRRLLPVVAMIHSVDSLRLLREIDQAAAELDVRPRVLLEVNLIDDPKKHGFRADELRVLWSELASATHLSIEGLMAMAAETDDPQTCRPTFAALRALRDDLATKTPAWPLPHLSMGMTSDFEVAVEEGATLVRVGSALWNGLTQSK